MLEENMLEENRERFSFTEHIKERTPYENLNAMQIYLNVEPLTNISPQWFPICL